MKTYFTKIFFAAIALFFTGSLLAQVTVIDSFKCGGIYRNYRLYIPAVYKPAKAVPLILNLHGLGSNAAQQEFYGDFRPIADTADFILAHPNGTATANGQGWNNFSTPGTGVDDLGFLSALIDTIRKKYSIDTNRVFSTGMSNGGFMSYDLACFLNRRIAAIASVSGSMIASHYTACNAQHPTPVMEIHGTADQVVSYPGNGGIVASIHIDSLVRHWVMFNHCTTTAIITQLPDTDPTDGCTVEHQVYLSGDKGSSVELYKVIGGGHAWPGASVNSPYGNTNKDFSASKEIWRFFSQYHLNIETGIPELIHPAISVQVYPNPASDGFSISLETPGTNKCILKLFNTLGQEVRNIQIVNATTFIPRASLPSGIYTLQLSSGSLVTERKLIFY